MYVYIPRGPEDTGQELEPHGNIKSQAKSLMVVVKGVLQCS